MAQFTTKCPHCGAELSVADEWVGMEVECPACKQRFTVSREAVPVARPVPVAAAPGNDGQAPYEKQIQYGEVAETSSPWGVTESEAQGISSLFMWWWICLLLIIPTLGLAFIAVLVLQLILLYKFWKLVPADEAETTPGKAVGFLFIPFFNIYWSFVAWYDLAKHYDRFEDQSGSSATSTVALWSLITSLCGWIPYVGFFFSIASLVLSIILLARLKGFVVNKVPRIG